MNSLSIVPIDYVHGIIQNVYQVWQCFLVHVLASYIFQSFHIKHRLTFLTRKWCNKISSLDYSRKAAIHLKPFITATVVSAIVLRFASLDGKEEQR